MKALLNCYDFRALNPSPMDEKYIWFAFIAKTIDFFSLKVLLKNWWKLRRSS